MADLKSDMVCVKLLELTKESLFSFGMNIDNIKIVNLMTVAVMW